ncbi:MAG TPA: response regulator transcription factor [Nitrospira sp.]|jgi:DNA-binding NarL/FixJ family response regulator|nr:response regulator transcription factor [Nitrospira sp.]
MIDVLLVDDHPVMRQLLRELLESHDDLTIVGEAGNGEDAVTEVTKLQPSVVIVDITLPTMSGIQATELMKMRSPFSAIIGLTAGVQGHTEKAMLAAGAVAIIDKAEVFEALYPAILQAVRRQVA